MKKMLKPFAIILITLGLTSCATNENLENLQPEASLLKSYTLKKDASGSYSLDYNVAAGVKSDIVTNGETKANEIFLYSSDNGEKNKVSKEFILNNDKLVISFINQNNDKKTGITLEDDNMSFLQKEESSLTSYEIVNNGDDTYTLNFSLKENIAASFVHNSNTGVYEIHLDNGESTTLNYTRTFTKEAGVNLGIGFVNHVATAAKNTVARGEMQPYKPRVIIQEE